MLPEPLTLPKPTRHFLPADYRVTDWPALEPWYDRLIHADLPDLASLRNWMQQVDELHNVLQEDLGWRYIRMTRNTQDEAAVQAYQQFIEHVSPHAARKDILLTRKYYEHPNRADLEAEDPAYQILGKQAAKDIELFREENVELQSQADLLAQQYGSISGAMTVEHEGKTLTLQQASKLLEGADRAEREAIWKKISARRAQDREQLDELFDKLLALRHQIALNAGFGCFTDYMFQALGRFDYGRAECVAFHDAVAEAVRPLNDEILADRRQRLGMQDQTLRPWDLAVDPYGTQPLHPFATDQQLLEGTLQVFGKLRPELGSMVRTLDSLGHLDLGSRIGKAPGGYNYPLHETGVPFIFMNAVGTQSDLTTMVHECGHAIHSILTRDLALGSFKNVPSEIAELASMSSELLTMDHWDLFYHDSHELRRARIQQILRSVTILPWIATVDAFQTWLYDNPSHTRAERQAQWLALHRRFFGEAVDWSNLEEERAYQWHRQLHIFEVPFYYIEYGIAQLGALQVWQQYKRDPQAGLTNFLNGLSLGYTRPIGEVYAAAGVRFDFSPAMIRQVVDFVRGQLQEAGFGS